MPKTFPGEKLLIKVIDDLADFLPYLVLVGRWVPYIYAKYIWKNVPNLAVTTTDIDFGVGTKEYTGKESVASYVMKLGYGERHVSMDRMTPFVPIKRNLLTRSIYLLKAKSKVKALNKICANISGTWIPKGLSWSNKKTVLMNIFII